MQISIELPQINAIVMSFQHLFFAITQNRRDLELINNFYYPGEYSGSGTNNVYSLNQAISQFKYIFCWWIVNIWSYFRIGEINAIALGKKANYLCLTLALQKYHLAALYCLIPVRSKSCCKLF